MKIILIQVGKTDDFNVNELLFKYVKRLKHYVSFEEVIIADQKFSKKQNIEYLKNKEGELIEKKILPGDFIIILDEKGIQYSSVGFSDYLKKKMSLSIKRLVFIIGGAYGFSSKVYEIANEKISLSKMTFSHQLIRVIFLEQLYRAFSIIKGEPYHHE